MRAVLLPVVAAQAVWVRRTTPQLPEAAGPDVGVAGGPGEPELRIGVVGESTAAGVGVTLHEHGIAGSIAREVATAQGCPVAWRAVGQTGATLRRIRHRLSHRLPGDLDLAVLLAGVNDVLARRGPTDWATDLTGALDHLSAVNRRVVVTGVPPFTSFPALPRLLATYLDQQAVALDEASQRVCAAYPNVSWIGSRDLLTDSAPMFASDGFHPSAEGYRRWARAISTTLHDGSASPASPRPADTETTSDGH